MSRRKLSNGHLHGVLHQCNCTPPQSLPSRWSAASVRAKHTLRALFTFHNRCFRGQLCSSRLRRTAEETSERRSFLYDLSVTCWLLSASGNRCPTQRSLKSNPLRWGRLKKDTSVAHFVTIKLTHCCICLVSAGLWLVMGQSGCHPTLPGHKSDH